MSAAFEPAGIITLTTDFGHKGPFVGSMKGVILNRYPQARIIDFTHEIMVHWPAEAGFWLARSFQYFPVGTVHVAVVDPGVGTQRDIIVLVRDGHAFVAPDNGLLAPLANDESKIYKLDLGHKKLRLDVQSATFHGRDIFAPVGAEIASGSVAPENLGPIVDEIIPSWVDEPEVSPKKIVGQVITVDHFGNLITNIDESLLKQFMFPVAKTGGKVFDVRRTYGEVTPGDYLALVNSANVLEIARAEQSASEGLGLERGAPVEVVEKD